MASQSSGHESRPKGRCDDIAIVGMACLFPGAPDLTAYWSNIVRKVDAIVDPPADSWDVQVHYDPDSRENDRIYCKKGGYLGVLAQFDPLEHGIPPLAVKGGEPEQWLALRVARQALDDAGFADGVPQPERTAVILGKGDYVNRGNLSALQHHGFVDQTLDIIRTLNPELGNDDLQRIREDLKRGLPPFSPDTVPALVPNIAAGRIANRLDLMGPSYTVDAACASSLIAADLAGRDLRSGRCDMALVGGMHVVLPMLIRQVFCQLGALSPLQSIRPFDESADGTILGEGVGMAVLERLEDAERVGRRVYAVIKGIGTASDGQGLGVMAPRVEGEILALERAYEATGISPSAIGLLEAHGTGTPVGDATELRALTKVFGEREGPFPTCALGSVKSMIGHLMPAAGMAALIKTALALHHKVLPPTLNVDAPHPELRTGTTRFYLNTEARPWIHDDRRAPRRAGVNAFGFGGINSHAVLEEHAAGRDAGVRPDLTPWDSELLVLQASTRDGLVARIRGVCRTIDARPDARLLDLAFTLNRSYAPAPYTLAVVAETTGQAREKLDRALAKISDPGCRRIMSPRGGLFFFEEPLTRSGGLAYLFPGEGSQYVNMLSDLSMHFPEARRAFERIERDFARAGIDERPTDCIVPPPTLREDERAAARDWLWQMRGAVTAVLSADDAIWRVLETLGIRPDAMLGHSTGEFAALATSGMIDFFREDRGEEFIGDLHQLFRRMESADPGLRASLVAIGGDSKIVSEVLREFGGALRVAMDNCPHQTVIAGEPGLMDRAVKACQTRGLICERLQFDRPYHTPDFEPLSRLMNDVFERWITSPPSVTTYTCATKRPFPDDVREIRKIAADQWMLPVAFRETIENMYEDGIRIFVEVGARGNLSSFVDDTLRGRDHLAIPADLETQRGVTQLNQLVGLLAAHGVEMKLGELYARRAPREVDLAAAPDAVGVARAESRERTRLETGWPVMKISEETIDAVRSTRRADRPETVATPPPPSGTARPAGAGVRAASGAGAKGTRSPVLEAHFDAMTRFLHLNEDVMRRYLARVRGGEVGSAPAGPRNGGPAAARGASSAASPATAPPATTVKERVKAAPRERGPLAGSIVSHDPGREIVVRRQLDPHEDLYLQHHTFGRRISASEPERFGMPVVPLTVSMEMMAETASLLVPGQTLVGMRSVRGARWVTPGDDRLGIEIAARREQGANEVHVQIHEARPEASAPPSYAIPLIEGTMVFGQFAPPPRASAELAIVGREIADWPKDRIYEEIMFHEGTMQGLASMDRLGDDGAAGTIAVRPRDGLIRGIRDPEFLADPVLMDQVGQVVGHWATVRWPDDVFFPFQVDELELFGPSLEPGGTVRCCARVAVEGADQTRADLEVVRDDGRLWARCRGWWDRRFHVKDRVRRFFLSPPDVVLSEPWPEPLSHPLPRGVVARRLGPDSFAPDFFTTAGGMFRRSLAAAVLTPAERNVWRELRGSVPQLVAWLVERLVAKDAAREYLADRHGLRLCPADIEIVEEPSSGRVRLAGPWTAGLDEVPDVALGQAAGVAYAAVSGGEARHRIGLAVERAATNGAGRSLGEAEQGVLRGTAGGDEGEWERRVAAAKKAAEMALRRDRAAAGPPLVARSIEVERGEVTLAFAAPPSGAAPAATWKARTVRDHEAVISVCVVSTEAGKTS